MNGLMMQQPLLVSTLLTHAERHHGSQQIASRRVEGDVHRYTVWHWSHRRLVFWRQGFVSCCHCAWVAMTSGISSK